MKQQKKVAELLLWTVLAIILGLVISFAFLPLLGVNPVESLKIMLSETFADKFSMGNILVKTTPLILTSLAFAFTYKANLYNIGAQGQFYVGCICSVAVTLQLQTKVPGPVVLITACLASMIGGGLTGFIIGFLKAKFNANEFLVSMMSTYVITYVMQLLLRTVLQESKHEYLKTDYIDNSAWLPKIINGTSVSLGIVIAVAAAIVIWFILYRTSMGYRIRVMGFNQAKNGSNHYIIVERTDRSYSQRRLHLFLGIGQFLTHFIRHDFSDTFNVTAEAKAVVLNFYISDLGYVLV